ncbi:hypothetical protein AAMO2058_001435700 [Amorphochlora amoebiformis]|mmetsp:Transcript_25924/g.41058  ORF Transcript_25924/g.41058 Transcript_25924/m.41058 type:complete len:143 (-) Transcript_25924:6551-6979(-)
MLTDNLWSNIDVPKFVLAINLRSDNVWSDLTVPELMLTFLLQSVVCFSIDVTYHLRALLPITLQLFSVKCYSHSDTYNLPSNLWTPHVYASYLTLTVYLSSYIWASYQYASYVYESFNLFSLDEEPDYVRTYHPLAVVMLTD